MGTKNSMQETAHAHPGSLTMSEGLGRGGGSISRRAEGRRVSSLGVGGKELLGGGKGGLLLSRGRDSRRTVLCEGKSRGREEPFFLMGERSLC